MEAKTGVALTADTRKRFQWVFSNWFQELAADAFALLLTGPAIFFSLCEFLQLLGNGYGLSASHPANDLRRRVLHRQLSDVSSGTSFTAVFQKHSGQQLDEAFNSGILIATPSKADIWADAKNRGEDDFQAAVLSELHESIELLAPLIYPQARAHLAAVAVQTIYTPQAYDADLGAHLKPMLAAIPPIESLNGNQHVAAEFSSILNVGWVTLLTKFDEFRITAEGNNNWDRMEMMHSLLEKAVELSEIRRQWESTP